MITGCYIFYVHNTFLDYHIDMALESINKQNVFDPIDKFVLYNNTCENKFGFPVFDNVKLLNQIQNVLGNKFKNYEFIDNLPNTIFVATDFEYQKNHITGCDYYIMHKSDFYLPRHILKSVQSYMNIESNFNKPNHCNFAKFDMRESITDIRIRELSKFSDFNNMVKESDVIHSNDHKWPLELSIDHKAIGYRGKGNYFDGTMFFYNESARILISYRDDLCGKVSSFWQQTVIDENRNNGINMWMSQNIFFAHHMFHEIPSSDPMARKAKQKLIKGHRF